MKKINLHLLGIYDLILAFGAIVIGVMMITRMGIFNEYPQEWLSKVSFNNWFIPGFIAILLFGLGNIIASIFNFRKKSINSWFASAIMGGIFFFSLVAQVMILGEWYLATAQFLILSVLQLCLCGYEFARCRKNSIKANI